MVKKTLFEIPVYSMSEKEFNRRWDKLDRKLRETYTTSSHHQVLAFPVIYGNTIKL